MKNYYGSHVASFSSVRSVGGGVFEYKMDFGPGYRICLGHVGKARTLWLEYKTGKKDGTITMALTRAFRETVIKRATGDDDYRRGLLAEAVNEILDGNLDAGKAMLRDYINATITFPEVARRLNKSSKNIHRMLGPGSNPRMDSLIGVLRILQEHERVRLQTTCLTATA